jgi:hypothetical protein
MRAALTACWHGKGLHKEGERREPTAQLRKTGINSDSLLLKIIIGLHRIVELLLPRVSMARAGFYFTEGPRCFPVGTAP